MKINFLNIRLPVLSSGLSLAHLKSLIDYMEKDISISYSQIFLSWYLGCSHNVAKFIQNNF